MPRSGLYSSSAHVAKTYGCLSSCVGSSDVAFSCLVRPLAAIFSAILYLRAEQLLHMSALDIVKSYVSIVVHFVGLKTGQTGGRHEHSSPPVMYFTRVDTSASYSANLPTAGRNPPNDLWPGYKAEYARCVVRAAFQHRGDARCVVRTAFQHHGDCANRRTYHPSDKTSTRGTRNQSTELRLDEVSSRALGEAIVCVPESANPFGKNGSLSPRESCPTCAHASKHFISHECSDHRR
jgi:hypothetical protein